MAASEARGLDTEAARRALADGDRAGAAGLCRAALARDPEDGAALMLLGTLLSTDGDAAGARVFFERAVGVLPGSADAHYSLAMSLDAQHRRQDALVSLATALKCDPDHVPSSVAAGSLLAAAGRFEEAVQALEHAVALAADAPAPRLRLVEVLTAAARTHARDGRSGQATRCLVRVAQLQSQDATAQMRLGVSLQRLGALGAARSCYERVLELTPDSADAYSNLGTLAQARRDPEGALGHYGKALALNPDHSDATAGLAAVLDWRGQYDDAMAAVRPRIEAGDRSAELCLMYGKLARRTGGAEEALALLVSRARTLPDRSADLQRLCFVIADLLEDQARYREAFEWYARGNRLKPAAFDRAGHRQAVDDLIRVFDAAASTRLPVSDQVDERPVFIVGMPRSGTSLVEQMLAAHPSVHAGGEMLTLSGLVLGMRDARGLAYPDAVAGLDSAAMRRLGAQYLTAFPGPSGSIRRMTDKMPDNYLHLGLIERMLPGARIVHCRRDPRDTAVSCFFQNFSGASIPFSYDLADLGFYYSEYRRLMDHWLHVSKLPMLHLDYEVVVADPQAQLRRLLAFLDLPYDPACLEFHRLARVATTASHAQVRQPVYRGSVGRYQHHAAALEPFLDALTPAVRATLEPGA